MTKKKGIASKLFIGLTGLTLLSCCFLGTTFARYTSGGSGTAEVGVALWDVDFENGEAAAINTWNLEVKNFTPNAAVYKNGSVRTNTVSGTLGVLTYNTEVAATLAIDYTDFVYDLIEGSSWATSDYTWSSGQLVTGENVGVTKNTAKEVISVTLSYQKNREAAVSITDDSTIPLVATNGTPVTYTFTYSVVWTTQDETDTTAGANGVLADALDTWLGANLESITGSLTLTMTQAESLPENAVQAPTGN